MSISTFGRSREWCRAAAVCVMGLCLITEAAADILFQVDFEDLAAAPPATRLANFPFANNVTPSGYTASDLQPVGGINASGAGVGDTTISTNVPGGNFLQISPFQVGNASSVGTPPGDYMYVDFTPGAGNSITFTDVRFDFGGSTENPASAIANRASIFWSLDGGALTEIGTTESVSNGGQPFSGFSNFSRDLSTAIGNQSGTVRIAIGLADNSSSGILPASGSPRKDLLYDNIIIEGVVIPEPATFGLVLIGLLAVLRRRQRIG